MARRSVALAALLAAGACAEPVKPLCDPADASAGRVALTAQGGHLAPGQTVMYDNGSPFVFVDGQCRYWASGPQIWSETRTGTLDAATAGELGARLHVGAWPDLDGEWRGSGVADAPTLIFDDSTHAVVCASLCGDDDIPASVKEMRDELPKVAMELWGRGTAVESSVRAIAIPTDPSQGIPFVAWPLARPITDFVRSGNGTTGEGILEDDAVSAATLRELRASFVRGDHGAFTFGMLPVTSGGAYYQLYLRDALPFEDARGLVPLPGLE